MRINYSNFTGSHYIYLPKFTASRNFKFIINCVPKHGTAWNTLLSKHTTDSDFGLKSDNYWYWNQVNDNINYSPVSNQRYWICLYWSGTQYFFYFMIDDDTYNIDTLPINDFTNWTLATSVNKNSNIYNNYELDLGNWNKGGEYGTDWPWLGSIDLYNTRIYADDSVWFDGPTQSVINNGYYNTGCLVSKDEGWTNFADTNSSYIRTINNFNPGNNSWEIDTSFVTGNDIVSDLCFISIHNNYSFGFATKESKILYTLSSNNSDWTDRLNGNTLLQVNKKYYMKFIYDYPNNLFSAYISEDGINYSLDISGNYTIYPTNNFIKFGLGRNGSNVFQGTISIKQTKIYINNTLWFDGSTAVEGIDYLIVGSPLYVPGLNIACKFSRYNYLQLNPIQYNYNGKNAKAIIRAYYISNTSSGGDLLARSSGADRSIYVTSDNRIHMYNGSDHFAGSLISDNWYWFGYEWDGYHYSLYYMLDTGKYNSYKELPNFSDHDWIKSSSFDDTNNIFESGFTLGYNIPYNNSSRYWKGMIDLNNTIIGNNIISYTVGKEGFITKSEMKTISQDTTDNITLQQGIKLTINPNPIDAKVVMWANGYKQTKGTNTLTAIEGTEINYTVSKKGYATQNNIYTLSSSDDTLNIILEEQSYSTPFEQPILSSNGTMGGSSFACNQSATYSGTTVAWRCFKSWDGNSIGESDRWQINGVNTNSYYYIEWYNPEEILMDKLTIYNAESSYTVSDYILQGSNDYITWNNMKTGTNTNHSQRESWEINLSDNSDAYKYFRLQCKPHSSTSLQICKIYISGYTN